MNTTSQSASQPHSLSTAFEKKDMSDVHKDSRANILTEMVKKSFLKTKTTKVIT